MEAKKKEFVESRLRREEYPVLSQRAWLKHIRANFSGAMESRGGDVLIEPAACEIVNFDRYRCFHDSQVTRLVRLELIVRDDSLTSGH